MKVQSNDDITSFYPFVEPEHRYIDALSREPVIDVHDGISAYIEIKAVLDRDQMLTLRDTIEAALQVMR